MGFLHVCLHWKLTEAWQECPTMVPLVHAQAHNIIHGCQLLHREDRPPAQNNYKRHIYDDIHMFGPSML